MNNTEFWIAFSKMGKASDADVIGLLRKFHIEVDEAASAATTSARAVAVAAAEPRTSAAYSLSRQAAKDVQKLQPGLRAKLEEFLKIAKQGKAKLYAELRSSQGSWQFEKIGNRGMSVRLNQGYRVFFEEGEGDAIEIKNIDNKATHGGH